MTLALENQRLAPELCDPKNAMSLDDKLIDFAKEEGLHTYCKYQVFPAVAHIAIQQPERRAEVIEWFRAYLQFAAQALPK